jgi:hypothetical protein
MTCRRQIQRRNTRNCTPYTPQPPNTSHPRIAKQMPAIPSTHQIKRRQSCRENNAFKAADLVGALRMTCRRQIQRRNNTHNCTPCTPQPPHTSHPHIAKQMPAITRTHQLKRRQSCRENNAFKAADFVVVLRMTCRRQIKRRNTINSTPCTPQPPQTSHPRIAKQMPAIPSTHQIKRRQSCRENNAFKAADLVAGLRMTCRRQIKRRNMHIRTPKTPQPPHTSRPHTPK